uniref:Pyridoxal-dependent decarboxylase domain-containing protein 1 n=1 Tax=Caenorhabditis tropicalis TaxID=1561998 RepID=A0A1I7U0R6_9PELO
MATSAEMSGTVQQIESIIQTIESKIEVSSQQHSPASNSSSTKSEDSGLDDGPKKSVTSAKPISRKSSRMSQSSGVSLPPVLEQLEHMIISDDWLGSETTSPIGLKQHVQVAKTRSREGQKLSELGRTLVTSASLKSYIDLLSSHHRQSIASWLYGNVNHVFSNLFRFPESQIYCSDPEATISLSIRNGIGHAVKLALKSCYGSDYATKGWKSFVEQGAPVVYVSPALHMDISSYLASEFGISDVTILPKIESDLSEIEGRIDHQQFEKILDEDLAAGKKPLILIGVVGTTILGQNDMISKILEIREKKAKFWLHITGQAIAALTFREPNNVLVHVLSQVDSMTLPIALWLGIPSAPVVTLHKSVEGYKASYREKLDSLPWWVASSYLSGKKIVDMIENAFLLSKVMLKGLSAIPEIEIVGVENPVDFANRIYKNKFTAPTVLIFKYNYVSIKNAIQHHRDLIQKNEDHDAISIAEKTLQDELEYGDYLNAWLRDGLLPESLPLGIDTIELGGNYGIAFRFCPLEHAATFSSHIDHVQRFVRKLTDIMRIVESTVAAKLKFSELKDGFPSLVLLPIRNWAGIGAVCYIPSIVKETNPEDWNVIQKQQISHLNLELVHQLKSVDAAFSSGDCTRYGVSCVKFGMLSDVKDLHNLVEMVAQKGKEIENSQQYLDSLADLIRQGIEAANQALRKENDQRLQNEGMMRQLPIMGSLVNWWSPLTPESQNIRGRAFNLKTGEMQETDVLFKSKKNSDATPPTTKNETPQVPHEPSNAKLEEESSAPTSESEAPPVEEVSSAEEAKPAESS